MGQSNQERKFVAVIAGHAKKIAPVNMKKEEHQFVIDGFLVDEVLKQIPPTLKIIQGYVHLTSRQRDERIAVPNALKKFGITYIRQSGAQKTVSVVFDKISKQAIKQNVSEACKALNMPYEKAYFKYIVLENESGATVKFEHTHKEIRPDETDLRKKMRVLGATIGNGRVQELLTQLSARKYRCIIKEEPVKFIYCTKD